MPPITADAAPFFQASQGLETVLGGEAIDGVDPRLLFAGQVEASRDEAVNKVHKAHDLAVIAVNALGGKADFDFIEQGLTTHLGIDKYDSGFAIRMALAEGTLILGEGLCLQIPELA